MPPALADIEGMIETKAAAGIGITIVGSPVGAGTMVPVEGLDNYAQPADQLNAFHEWLARTLEAHRPRLLGYVYVNPFDDDKALSVAENWLKEDGFVGLIANTSVRGEYLGSPRAEQFFALAAQASCPVLLHPAAHPVGTEAMRGHLGLIEHVVRPADVTCGVAALLAAGWLDKYPELKLIVPNAGGALPLLTEKLDLAQQRVRSGGPQVGLAGGRLSAKLRKLYVDSATPSALALAAAVAVFGPANVLFGTDAPPLAAPLSAALAMIDGLPGLGGPPGDPVAAIREGNARRLFGLAGAPGGEVPV
jgi:predicted TIM-barrel fold metal-dependent hydrolase